MEPVPETVAENVKVLLKLQNVLVEQVSLNGNKEGKKSKSIANTTNRITFGQVWLTRFQSRNALDRQTLEDIVTAFNYLQTQFHLNIVVLAGRGKSFCAGADLKSKPGPKKKQPQTGREKRYNIQLGRRAIAAIENLEAITIARVHGHAAGGGFGLMQACDLKVVVENTRLWLPEVDIKLPLTWGLTARLIRDVGRAKALELISMGTDFLVRDAYRLGLINRIASNEKELDSIVREWVVVLGTKNTSTLHFIKTQFKQLDNMVDLGRATDTDNDYLLYNRLLDASL